MSSTFPKKFNYNLEILRGFAALIVVIHHMIYYNKSFNPKYYLNSLAPFEPPGHLSVLIFFILSGYVIGINHKDRLDGNHNILSYLKKRFLRIYPIYFIAIVLGLAISNTNYSWTTIVSNFSLTQNIFYPVIWENSPAWSLNYEILYYLLFIPISFFEIKPIIALIFFFTIGIISIYCTINPIVTAYSFGYCFWLVGLTMARNFKECRQDVKLVPVLLYFLGIENLISGSYIFRLLSLIKRPISSAPHFWAQNIINADDLIFLPYCFMIVLFLAGRDFKYKKHFFLFIQIFPLFVIISQFRHPTHDIHKLYVGLAYIILATLSYFINIQELFIRKVGIKLGSWSYGIYIIHFPVLILFGRITAFSEGLYYYIIRVILYLILTLSIAWLLESKFQPIFKKMFKPIH